MTIRSELLELQTSSGGLLQAEQVVRWARENPESSLYRNLEWDDAKAGEQFRIWQVRRLIAVHVISNEGVRQLVSLTIDRAENGGYRDIYAVIGDTSMREVLLADALADLERLRLKYQRLVELASVWKEAGKVRVKQVKRSGAKLTPRTAKSSKAAQA